MHPAQAQAAVQIGNAQNGKQNSGPSRNAYWAVQVICGATTRTPIAGGYTSHECGEPKGHPGPHRCGSMQQGEFPCHLTWDNTPKEEP